MKFKPTSPYRCTRCNRKLRAVVYMVIGMPFGEKCARKEAAGA